MPPRPLPNLVTAVGFVATHPPWSSPWSSALPAFDGAFIHQALKSLALVLLPGLEHKGDRFALTLGPDVQLGRKAALTPTECFGCWVPFFAPAAC